MFSQWTAREAYHLSPQGLVLLNALLLAVVLRCAWTDGRQGKIFNAVTFPGMLGGVALNTWLGGVAGLRWGVLGLFIGLAIQWVPFMLHLAKAGDVKLLAAVGAIKGWAFCCFGFLYGAAVFGLFLLPWLAWRGELGRAGRTVGNYAATAAVSGSLPQAPAPAVKGRYVPWGVGLGAGFIIALILEAWLGSPFWVRF